MENKVIFYGSFPQKGRSSYGGGEEGNFRTTKLLSSAGYDVRVIKKIRNKSSASGFTILITYPFRMIAGIVEFFIALFCNRKKAIVHISGFCGHTILNEFILLSIAKSLGYFTVFELRGGGANKFYSEGSTKYKKMFCWIVSHADYIFSQGIENKPLLDSIKIKPFFYYPNYVEADFIPAVIPEKPREKINLLFFGRVEIEKNVLLVVDIAEALQKQFSNITLTIIGNGKQEYVDAVKSRMKEKLAPGSFFYYDGCLHQEIKHHLEDKHFYVFPSQQEYEGHSNAVTEAMAFGVIPIVSPQGFSRTVVGHSRLVIDNYSVEDYASSISKIITNNEIDFFSSYVFDRVSQYYKDDVVGGRLRDVYKEIFDSNIS